MRRTQRWEAFTIAWGLALAGAALPAWAAVTLTVRVVHGGLDLDFGAFTADDGSRTEELELSMTNASSAQYRLYQECPGWLVNERGDRLPEEALLMQLSQGLSGVRGSGGIVAVTERPQELFVSNAEGSSDTVRLAYSIRPPGPTPASAGAGDVPALAGTYRGVLRFTAESLDTGTIATETLNVQATIRAAVSLRLERLESAQLSFGTIKPGEPSPNRELTFRLANNTASPTHVLQVLGEPLANSRGDRLPADAVTSAVLSPAGGGSWQPVSEHPDAIVTDDRGELRDLHLAYAAAIPAAQPAGLYRGTLRLQLMSGGVLADEALVPVELTVDEVFTMAVVPVDGGGSALHFDRSLAGRETVERRMRVEVRTNMGRPYQVLAGLDHPLVLETGDMLPVESLVWSVPPTERGTVLLAPERPVAVGYAPLYQSDAQGSPEAFILTYRLTVPADARDGLYSGQLRFTITLF
ncbi:MAG: hypothetical protein HY599_05905 [Candidatus Omnitrophica bacterium]|nr:hypothetical protein [Candidatus Omnitrophota bacterium]